ncbi:hypothetical protein SDC9_59766 [bioreactor metagenome]|uniref:Spermatogenesis-associated protein 20-like TRX domain-containing protein n=1 Tax=bioreactor metagenome TaxID=1076179 RepID=A0A644XBB2_9ZZZZ
MTNDRNPNRLVHEKSPYLLQHAYNPVNWFPWGDEVFDKARQEDKPVFLSIGYSTCHWCHVMARESFEDESVAQLLNREFIAVKVDREERPDIDAVYMQVCQLLTSSGGWPLTILMTPDQKPFFAATYLPKTAQYGRPGLTELLNIVAREWKISRQKVLASGVQITEMLKSESRAVNPSEPSKALVDAAYEQFYGSFRETWGGFGGAPKFPMPHNLIFLLRYTSLAGNGNARYMAEHTLEQMYRGGIFDHIGGGFSRYSTDERWLIPHFEKMLYDNALLTYAYLEGWQCTRKPIYRRVAEQTLQFAIRELMNPLGGFYCGQDADSEGVEGKYYALTADELEELLGKENGKYFCDWFGITAEGNFEGKNIPNLISNPGFAEENEKISSLLEKVYVYRQKRTKLHCDDKILTSWNAMMLSALSKAALVLNATEYGQAAGRLRQFIQKNLMDPCGRLMVRWRDGQAAIPGHLDDYAFYALALLELYQVDFDASCIAEAVKLAEEMLRLFGDEKEGGFYLYASDAEQLISRPKETYDGAVPSGNSVAALLLVRLSKLTGEKKWLDAAMKQLRFMSGAAAQYPSGFSFAMLAQLESLYPSKELVCVNNADTAPEGLSLLLREKYLPNLTVILKTPRNQEQLSQIASFLNNYPFGENPTFYLCRNGSCAAPSENLNGILDS